MNDSYRYIREELDRIRAEAENHRWEIRRLTHIAETLENTETHLRNAIEKQVQADGKETKQ